MERFEAVIKHTLKWEGGYVWDKDDSGGETNYGITKRQYPDLDIKNLTVEEAIAIYHGDYWKPYMDKISSFKIASRLFDLSVNMGHQPPNKMLQEAVNFLGSNIVVDGFIGPQSITAINQCNADDLYTKFYELAKARYERLAKKGNNAKFLKGWMNRLNDPFETPIQEYEPENLEPIYTVEHVAIRIMVDLGLPVYVFGSTEEDAKAAADRVIGILKKSS